MDLEISREDCAHPYIDRSGTAQEPAGPQGFHVGLNGLTLRFEDETDAEAIARAILARLGCGVPDGPIPVQEAERILRSAPPGAQGDDARACARYAEAAWRTPRLRRPDTPKSAPKPEPKPEPVPDHNEPTLARMVGLAQALGLPPDDMMVPQDAAYEPPADVRELFNKVGSPLFEDADVYKYDRTGLSAEAWGGFRLGWEARTADVLLKTGLPFYMRVSPDNESRVAARAKAFGRKVVVEKGDGICLDVFGHQADPPPGRPA